MTIDLSREMAIFQFLRSHMLYDVDISRHFNDVDKVDHHFGNPLSSDQLVATEEGSVHCGSRCG